jgi:omega-amidase
MPRVYGFQLDLAWQDKRANHDRVRRHVDTLAPEPGSMLVLPEMFDVGFTMNLEAALSSEADTPAFLSDLARQTNCNVLAGYAGHNGAGAAVNQAGCFDAQGRLLTTYVKTHGFSPAGEHEKYAPGEGPVVFESGGIKWAPMVCYDLRFPELFRRALDLGAEAFVVIANWPSARVDHWVTLARARAIENLAYVVAVNRCGRDPHLEYPGRSLIVDPKGVVIAEADGREQILQADLDVNVLRGWRRDFPALRDRRPS